MDPPFQAERPSDPRHSLEVRLLTPPALTGEGDERAVTSGLGVPQSSPFVLSMLLIPRDGYDTVRQCLHDQSWKAHLHAWLETRLRLLRRVSSDHPRNGTHGVDLEHDGIVPLSSSRTSIELRRVSKALGGMGS